jgi:regulatory protein
VTLDAGLRAKALACIAQREHSRVELRVKLLAYLARRERAGRVAGIEPREPHETRAIDPDAEIETVLDWLVERDLLSGERFVEGRVRVRAGRFGHMRVRQEIERHGLALDEPALRSLRHTEPARAYALWLRRFGAVAAEPAQRAKQMRFLLARGFDAEVVRRVVSGAFIVEDEVAEAR